MPKPRATKFTAFDFTQEEFYAATRLSQLNLMLIQNLAAEAVEAKAALKIDLTSGKSHQEAAVQFIQQEAELQGQIGAYEHLLMLASDTKLEVQPK